MTKPTTRPRRPEIARPAAPNDDRAFSTDCRMTLAAYRAAAVSGAPSPRARAKARQALLHLGGDPEQGHARLQDYDAMRHGPFLGVSDEGSAAAAIRDAALASPKVRALPRRAPRDPLAVGVAIDAERLGGIGEVAVGPDEYAEIWLECVDRILITTNVGTRVNLRVFRRPPRVVLHHGGEGALARARQEIAAACRPFVETPDGKPRPLTVLIDIPRTARIPAARRKAVLCDLVEFVRSGKASGRRRAPKGHDVGFSTWVRLGLDGKRDALEAIDLAAACGIRHVVLDGVKRKDADEEVSQAGLLDYFPPGIVGPLLRRARDRGVAVRAANLPDTGTIARSVWVGLTTARGMGANLGKYGTFPLTRGEIDEVVQQVQRWMPGWSAAPVFYVDQGLLWEAGVDVEHDLPRGLERWLDMVAAHGVRVVLIDTMKKATGRHLVKTKGQSKPGYLGWSQIGRVEAHARKVGIHVLWAGGLGHHEVFEMGRLGVFGVYVTTTTATTIPVDGGYALDPALSGVKEPTREGVLRTKVLIEAGFLAERVDGELGTRIRQSADRLLRTLDEAHAAGAGGAKRAAGSEARVLSALSAACMNGWKRYWSTLENAPGRANLADSKQPGPGAAANGKAPRARRSARRGGGR